jgi:hypothetical protein
MLFYGIIDWKKDLTITGVKEDYYTPSLEDFFEDIMDLEVCSPEFTFRTINPRINEIVFNENCSHLIWFKSMWRPDYLYKSPTYNEDLRELIKIIDRKLVRLKK